MGACRFSTTTPRAPLAACAAMLAVAGLAVPNAHAQPRMSSAMMRSMMYDRAMGGRFDPSTFDEFSDSESFSMMRRGQEAQVSLKSELARQIIQQDFSRDPEGVLAARVKLAAEARNKRLHPGAEEDGAAESPPGDDAGMDSGDDEGEGETPPDGAVDGGTLLSPEQMQALLTMGGDVPPEVLAEMSRSAGGLEDDQTGSTTKEEQKVRAAERKRAVKDAQEFRLLVVAGRWDLVADFLATRFTDPKHAGDAGAVFSFLLQQLVSDDQAMTPDEILAVAETAPLELTDAHINALGTLIQASAERGCDTGPLAATIRRGTRHFGGASDATRKRAAALLVAAGMPVAAQEYLPPLSDAESARDADLLNLYAVYFHALSKERQGEEQREAAREGWRLCQQVLSIEGASNEQRSKALTITIRLLDTFDHDAGDTFLRSLFSDESEIAWMTLDKVNRAAGNLLERQAPAEYRLRALRRIQRVGEAVIEGAGDSAAAWRTGLDMLTLTLLREAELTRSGQDDPRMQVIPADQLASVLPDARWLTTIDPGLAAKLELMVAATDGGSGESASVLSMIRPIIDTDPERAKKLASALIDAWPNFVGRGAPSFDDYDPYGMMSGAYTSSGYSGYSSYSSYSGRGSEGAIPLTRARQRRSLERLGEVLGALDAAGVHELPAASLVTAFGASHSQAEVYARPDIEAVFGPFESMDAETRSRLAEDMRTRLGSQWRNPGVQEQANTKRTDKQLALEVDHGYEVALDLAHAGVAADPADWRPLVLLGNLDFDRAEFRYGQNVDFETYTKDRDAAFAAYSKAADLYAATLDSPDVSPSAEVYLRWFSAALGASDLGLLTRQDQPDVGQIDRVIAAINRLPGDEPDRHRGLFAKSVETAMADLNPELKPRFVRESMRIVGDHPDGRKARELLQYYDDLLQEISLVLSVDGPTQVGHGDAFGVQLSIWSTRQTAREAGSFSKYLRNEMWHPATGQPVDYRDDLEKHIRETLGETFDVVAVQFHDPGVQPVSIERPGWESFPLAYMLLKPKDARTDRVPPLRLDMDFSDGQGYVILPIATPPVLIDAKDELPASRHVTGLEIEEVLDDRMVGSAGKLRLEIHAKGRGVVPTLAELLDTSTLAPFAGFATDDHGLNIVELDAGGQDVAAVTERSWTLELTPPPGGVVRSITFPTGRYADAKLALRRYSDADIVDAPATASILTIEGPASWLPMGLAGLAAVAAAGGAFWWLRLRRGPGATVAIPAFRIPEVVTPVSALALLRRIQAANGDALDSAEQARLAGAIDQLERAYFAPGECDDQPPLEPIVQEWVAAANS